MTGKKKDGEEEGEKKPEADAKAAPEVADLAETTIANAAVSVIAR